VSALPLIRRTFHKAIAAPTQTGSNKTAMINLIHFGTRESYPQISQNAQIFKMPSIQKVCGNQRNLRINLKLETRNSKLRA
jgi:hypothetical protein